MAVFVMDIKGVWHEAVGVQSADRVTRSRRVHVVCSDKRKSVYFSGEAKSLEGLRRKLNKRWRYTPTICEACQATRKGAT